MGSGGLVVMDDETCMVDMARFFMEFTQDESLREMHPLPCGNPPLCWKFCRRSVHGKGIPGTWTPSRCCAQKFNATACAVWARVLPIRSSAPSATSAQEYEAHI